MSEDPEIQDDDLNEARAALERLEAQLRELDELSREESPQVGAKPQPAPGVQAPPAPVQPAPAPKPAASAAKPAPKPAPVPVAPPSEPTPAVPTAQVQPASADIPPAVTVPSLQTDATVVPNAPEVVPAVSVAATAAGPVVAANPAAAGPDTEPQEPSVFREVRTAEKAEAKSGSRWWPLLFLAIIAALSTAVWWAWKEGLVTLETAGKNGPVNENGYVEQPISLEPLPTAEPQGIAAGSALTSSPSSGEPVDVDVEPDFILFKQPVELGGAVVFFQNWELGKIERERDGKAALGYEWIRLNFRVRNESEKAIDPRRIFKSTTMFDGEKRRLPNLVLERPVLQGDIPKSIPPKKSKLLTFVYQAPAGSGDFHLRIPGTPPRQLDLSANPPKPVAPRGVSLFP